MRRHVRLGSALLIMVLGLSARLHAEPATFSLDKVKRGQTGYGMTTFSGMRPERFTFEVVSVVHNFLPKQDIILVKSDDPKMQVPGFWQGMSGSPLYIDDKLTCAFSYGFRFNKVAIGGCTPIEYMKKEGLGSYRRATVTAAAGSGPRIVQPAAATMSDWRRLTPTVDPQAALDALGPAHKSWLLSAPLPEPVNKPVATDGQTMTASVPLSVAGFSAPAFGQLEKMFGDSNVVPVRAGGSTSTPPKDAPNHFEMGGAIAVELIRGDMSAAAIGTVTYIDGDKVLAFGHPMFQTGETYAPVSTAYVHAIIPSAQSAFVMGSAMTEIGSLTQDRQSSIAADTGLRTPTIPMEIAITTTAGTHVVNGDFKVDLLANKFLTPSLAGAALMNAINYYLPDRDDVTARVESTVKVKGIAEPIQFTDYLYANDGAASVMGAVRGLRVIVPLLLNPFVPVTIERVDIKVDLRFEANYGDVKELKVTTGDLVVGRNVVKVLMQSYDSKDIIEEIPVDVPASLAGSIVQLEITSGDAAKLDSAPPTNFPSLVAAFRKLLPGNVWAATIYPADEGVALDGKLVRDLPASVQDKLHPQSHTQRAQAYKPVARTVSPAKRVINGSASMLVRVRAQ
jgi:hypothetical protein